MNGYEYKVVPAPNKGRKSPGIKGPEARFAHSLETAMNELAADGWEYLRADILPSEERQGLTSTQTVYRSVLVFRRVKAEELTEAPDAEDLPPITGDEINDADDQNSDLKVDDTAEPEGTPEKTKTDK